MTGRFGVSYVVRGEPVERAPVAPLGRWVMQLSWQHSADVRIARMGEPKLTYPVLSAFFLEVCAAIEDGARKLVLDLEAVTYIDSASIGCLMDIHRLLAERGGLVRLAGLQPRVETMLSMTGVHRILDVRRDVPAAVAAFARAERGGSVDSAAPRSTYR